MTFCFWRYSAVVCHKLNHINSQLYSVLLEIVVGYKKLTKFQGTQVILSVLLEELDMWYPSLNS